MLHAYSAGFDVTGNLKKFYKFFLEKQLPLSMLVLPTEVMTVW